MRVADLRKEKAAIGVRYRDDEPAKRYRISVDGNLTVPLHRAMEFAFRAANLEQSDTSKVDILLSVVSVQIEEKTHNYSSYNVNLVLDAKALATGTDQVLWTKRKSGHGTNSGRSGVEVNYQETLSRGLENAMAALLGDAEFSAALCQSAAGGAPAPAATSAPAAASATAPVTAPASTAIPMPAAAPAPVSAPAPATTSR